MDNNNMYGTENTSATGSTDSAAQNSYQNNYQSNYQQPQYQQPPYQQPANLEEPMTMGEWLITMLICMVPCLNIVMIFVWAFSKSEKKSKSNFFKAALLVYAICLGLVIVCFGVFGGILAAAVQGY